MDYSYMSYWTTYDSVLTTLEGTKKESKGRGSACFSSMFTGYSTILREGKEFIIEQTLTSYIYRDGNGVKKNRDNFCPLSDAEIDEYIDEVKKITGIQMVRGVSKLEKEADQEFMTITYTIPTPTILQSRLMATLCRYLYEKTYVLLLSCAFGLKDAPKFKGVSLIGRLIAAHVCSHGPGHSAFSAPCKIDGIISQKEFYDRFNKDMSLKDYVEMRNVFTDDRRGDSISLSNYGVHTPEKYIEFKKEMADKISAKY